MTLNELDRWFNNFLKKEDFPGDPSLNGIQIQNSAPDTKEIKKIAFAVDACEATAKEAAKTGADLLFVHHGLFWGGCQTVTGAFYNRLATFIKNDLALAAYHIPLDANQEVGNNYGLARLIGMTNLEPFGFWRGMAIGVKGELPEALSLEQLAKKLQRPGQTINALLPFGKASIKTVGIISGGGGDDVDQAIELGLDAFVTGEFPHEQYHLAKEMGINVIGAGHYETEVAGVSLVQKKVQQELGLETVFIDLPTGL